MKETFNIDKEKHFSEWYSEIVAKAELADLRYNIKGFVVFMPWSAQIIEILYSLFEKELQSKGHLPSFFPALISEENFKKEAQHVKGFSPDVFWVTKVGETEIEKLALRPTSETAFYQMYNLWIRSYKDLPFKLYQRANIWRYETRATRPFIRSREFYWIETHNAFATKEEAEAQVQEDIKTTDKIMHQKLGIPFLPLKRPEWDKFAGAVYTIGSDSLLPDGRLIQQPSTHFLGQGFSKVFDVKFKDKDGQEKLVWITCYGPAMSRIVASIISMHGDNSGLVLPFIVSPIQIIIVPIYDAKSKKVVLEYAEKIKKDLEPLRVKIDDTEKKPGEKFYFWEMKGVPLRIEIGNMEIKNKQLTLFLRDERKKIKISEKNLSSEIQEQGRKLDERLKEKADKWFEKSIVDAESLEDIEEAIKNKKIARCNFCSTESAGERCSAIIEKELAADVRGSRGDKQEQPKGKCLVCGKKANVVVYVGKSY
ncbi:proline--tRNA ligase [Candidatus Pacearchaeota archaeon]|nr:proline--tRNA ligase [Candidatus Pacearchaeota archaeon]